LSLLKDASVENSVSGTRKAFDFLDRNHDGKITANELKDIYISMNSTVDQTRIEKFVIYLLLLIYKLIYVR
jgi:Ca2+-binding EF-hand superfamily protein